MNLRNILNKLFDYPEGFVDIVDYFIRLNIITTVSYDISNINNTIKDHLFEYSENLNYKES